MSTPTPRTNRAWNAAGDDNAGAAWGLARTLERELNAERARLDWLEENAIPWSWLCLQKVDEIRPIVVTWKSNLAIRAAIDAAMKEGK